MSSNGNFAVNLKLLRSLRIALVVSSLVACRWGTPPDPECEARCDTDEHGTFLRCGWCEGEQPVSCDGFFRIRPQAACRSTETCDLIDLGRAESAARCVRYDPCHAGVTTCSPDGDAAIECVVLLDGSSARAYYPCVPGRTCGEGLGRCDEPL